MTSAPVQTDSREEAKAQLLDAVRKFHRSTESDRPFVPGVTPLYSSGPVFDDEDRVALVEAALEMRIVAKKTAQEFESRFSKTIGVRKSHLVNSGSSANLLAISALTSPQLADRRLVAGDEVITVAAGFPTTVNPVLQNGRAGVRGHRARYLQPMRDRSRRRSARGPRRSRSPTRWAIRTRRRDRGAGRAARSVARRGQLRCPGRPLSTAG